MCHLVGRMFQPKGDAFGLNRGLPAAAPTLRRLSGGLLAALVRSSQHAGPFHGGRCAMAASCYSFDRFVAGVTGGAINQRGPKHCVSAATGRMQGDRGKAWPPTRALASGTGSCLRFVAACLPFFPRFQLGAIAIERFGIEVEHARITAAVTAFVICRGARQSRWRFVVPC